MTIKERKRNKIFESTNKIIYETEEDFVLAQFFKDTVQVGENLLNISGKGVLNNSISSFLLNKLDMVAIENHFVDKINMREQLIQAVDIIPINVFVSNVACNRYVNEIGLEEGYVFDTPMIDFQVRNGKILTAVGEEQIMNFGWLKKHELKDLKKSAYRINDFITGFFAAINLRVMQIKLKFGRIFNGEDLVIMLASDISPETLVLQSINSNERFSIDSLPADVASGKGIYIYQELANRLLTKK